MGRALYLYPDNQVLNSYLTGISTFAGSKGDRVMPQDFAADVAAIQSIDAVPTILDVVCRITGMGFAAVARVTEDRWVACTVLDNIDFGLKPGGELKVETTICNEIRTL